VVDPLPPAGVNTASPALATDSTLTVAALIDRYIAEVRPLKRWGRTKDFSLAAIKAKLGREAVSTLTSDTMVAYARKRAAEGAGPVTVQMDIAYLGNVLRVARSVWKLPIPRNLVPDAREALKLLGLVGKSRKRKRVAKPAELAAVKAQWASDVPTALIDFAVASSMRLSEIVALHAEDRDGDTILILTFPRD
jgi:integrase